LKKIFEELQELVIRLHCWCMTRALAEENPLLMAHQSIDLNGVVKSMPSIHRILAATQHEKRTWGDQGV